MNDKAKEISQYLEKIRDEFSSTSKNDLWELKQKYSLTPYSENFSRVDANELHWSLSSRCGLSVTRKEFLEAIPEVCTALGMEIIPLYSAENPDIKKPVSYRITLF